MIVKEFPAPKGDENGKLKALIFDSYYDNFKGAICLVRVFDGTVKVGDKIKMMQTGKVYDVTEVGIFVPNEKPVDCLRAGDVGYIAGSVKTISDVAVGDTITKASLLKQSSKSFVLTLFAFSAHRFASSVSPNSCAISESEASVA